MTRNCKLFPLILFSKLIFLSSVGLLAEDQHLRQQAEALWQKAEEVSAIDGPNMPPYDEQASFSLEGLKTGSLQGSFVRDFVNADNWMTVTTVGQYRGITIRKDGHTYTNENTDFTPVGVEELRSAIPVPRIKTTKDESIRKIFPLTVDGAVGSCIQTEISFPTVSERNVSCVSDAQGTLLSFSRPNITTRYGAFIQFHGKLVPTRVEVREQGNKIVEATISYRDQPKLSAASLQVPDGLQPQPECKVKTPSELKFKTDPDLPRERFDGSREVILQILIGKDGRVSKSMVVQSSGKEFDRNAEEAVRRWRFKPSLCDGEPIEVRVSVEVNFRME